MRQLDQLEGIVRARTAAASTLMAAIRQLGHSYTERSLATAWLNGLCKDHAILPFGWYQPPPAGMSVLIGSPPDYGRLNYRSLRDPDTFPSDRFQMSPESILYPYFSAVDRATLMIGDHVGTYYGGRDRNIRDAMKEVYAYVTSIADYAKSGMSFSEVYDFASSRLDSLGAKNNIYNTSGGSSFDVGHTIPYFGRPLPAELLKSDKLPQAEIAGMLAKGREFVSKENLGVIEPPCAFTIEPQVIIDGLPMISFHVILVFIGAEKHLIQKFEELFESFGMSEWIYDARTRPALS